MSRLWEKGGSGSHAGRGFHYQDAVATEFAIRAWHGQLPLARLIPEGLEDVSLELDHALHLQAKSAAPIAATSATANWPAPGDT
jgi:hypothetical protein